MQEDVCNKMTVAKICFICFIKMAMIKSFLHPVIYVACANRPFYTVVTGKALGADCRCGESNMCMLTVPTLN
jgi:hypothetical protein